MYLAARAHVVDGDGRSAVVRACAAGARGARVDAEWWRETRRGWEDARAGRRREGARVDGARRERRGRGGRRRGGCGEKRVEDEGERATRGRRDRSRVTMSCDDDPFFYHAMEVREEDYGRLRAEQRLVVGFDEFLALVRLSPRAKTGRDGDADDGVRGRA